MAPPSTFSTQTIIAIPLSKLLPNPRQPRRRFKPGSIQEIADSLKTLGQKTPLKVRPLTEEEKKANPGFEYLVIGGHRRRAGAEMAGLPTLDCWVLNIPPEDTHLESLMDNNQEEMDWWDWDLAIEEEQRVTGLSQRDVAKRLGVSRGKIYKAITITKVLSPTVRGLIDKNLQESLISSDNSVDTQNKAFLITESHLMELAVLGSQEEVEKAFQRVLDDYMSVPETHTMVAAMRKGVPPETARTPDTQARPNPAKKKTKVPATPALTTSPTGSPSADPSATAPASGDRPTSTPDLSSQIGALMATHTLGKHIPGANLVMGRLFPHVAKLFHSIKGGLMKMGVKNQIMGTIFTLLIFLFVGSALIHFTSQLLKGIYRIIVFSHLSTAPQGGGQALVAPSRSADGNGGTQQGSVPLSTAGGQRLVVPSQGADGTKEGSAAQPVTVYLVQSTSQSSESVGRPASIPTLVPTQAPEKPAQAISKKPKRRAKTTFQKATAQSASQGPGSQGEPSVPDDLKERVKNDKTSAQYEATNFYAFSYKNDFSVWRKRFFWLSNDYDSDFNDDYFSKDRQKEFKEGKQYYGFDQEGDPKLVNLTNSTDDIAVVGTVTLYSDAETPGKVIWKKRMALTATFTHNPDKTWYITQVTEKPAAQGADIGKSVIGAVRDANQAVNSAQQGEETVNKAKGILGF